MMKAKKYASVFLAGVLGITVASAVQAGKMTGSGHNANHNVSTESSKLADGSILMHMHDADVIMGNNAGNPFNQTALDCYSTYVASSDMSAGKGGGYCNGIDKDGDLWWISFQGDFGGGTWTFLGGTGKFDGISGGGNYKPVVQMAGGRSINSWDGTWEMK